MIRFCALLVSAFVLAGALPAQDPAKPIDLKFTGQIVEGDAKDTARQYPCKVHVVKLQQGRAYLIDLVCNDKTLDPFLRLEDSDGKQIAADDDGGGDLNARVRFTAAKDEPYKIIVTTFAGGEGNYVLTVKDVGGVAIGKKPDVPQAKKEPVKDVKLDSLSDSKHWIEVEGRVKKGDSLDPVQNQPCKTYAIELKKGVNYVIDMRSLNLDSFLRVVDPSGKEIAKDDDSGGGQTGLDAQVRIQPAANGTYRIVATSFAGGVGEYMLKVALDGGGKVAKGDKGDKVEPKSEPKREPKREPPAEKKVADNDKIETPTDKKAVEVAGKLADGDPLDGARNQLSKKYSIDLDEGVVYVVDLVSADFDAFLRILDSKGKELAFDDDGGGDLHARVTFAAPAKGTYRIVATSFDGGAGDFKLKVRQAAKAVKYDAEKVHVPLAEPIYITGRLTAKDDKDAVQENSPCQITQVKLAKGKTYVIDLVSGQMDSFLRVENAKKKELADDDDSGGGLNSRLSFTPDEDGVYRLIATNLDGMEGNYILSIREEK